MSEGFIQSDSGIYIHKYCLKYWRTVKKSRPNTFETNSSNFHHFIYLCVCVKATLQNKQLQYLRFTITRTYLPNLSCWFVKVFALFRISVILSYKYFTWSCYMEKFNLIESTIFC